MFTNKMRILITEKCNANCPNCFNANYRKNNEMDLLGIEKMSKFLREGGIKSIKIMGGEPTMHSNYLEAMEILQKNFDRISIFTNAISEKLQKTDLRNYDSIIYNFNFLNKENITNKLMLDKPGFRTLEIQVNKNTDVRKLIETLDEIKDKEGIVKVGVNLTLDCMETDEKALINMSKKWEEIEAYLYKEFKRPVNIDHAIPICIKDRMQIKSNVKTICRKVCAGLIDADFNLLYCNQFQEKVGELWDENGVLISEEDFDKGYMYFFEKKEKINADKGCSKCKKFKVSCNGGCFRHKIKKC